MRLRERSYGINTLKKFKIITDQNIIKESEKKSNYDQLKDTVPTYFTQKEPSSIEKTYNIPLHPPKIENKKRDYSSRGKPIRFHENATISKFNPADVGEINGQKGNVDFLTLMAMFDESEINEMNETNEEQESNYSLETVLKDSSEQDKPFIFKCKYQFSCPCTH